MTYQNPLSLLSNKKPATLKSKSSTLSHFNYILLLFVLLTACGQVPEAVEATLPVDQAVEKATPINSLEQIKEEFGRVEKLFSTAQLTVDSLDYECENDPKGGTINFYKYKNELRLISNDFYEGDHSGTTEKYYVKDGKLFFAFVEKGSWTFDSDLPENVELDPINPPTKDEMKEFRFYFAESGKPLQCLEKEYVIRSSIDLPVDPDQVQNTPNNCEDAQEFYQKFNRLVKLEIMEDLEKELCL
jgi:hypothetical protein